MITEDDYEAFLEGRQTVQDLAHKYQCSGTTIRNDIQAYTPPNDAPERRRVWTPKDRENLKRDILAAIPHDPECCIQRVLEQYKLKSISQALSLLKVKTLSELRGNSPELRSILKTLHLRLAGNMLYSPDCRGRYYEDRQILLDAGEEKVLRQEPLKWLKTNLARVKAVCFKSN